MSERNIYRPGTGSPPRRKEWVSLPGGDLCVWEMKVADTTRIVDGSERPLLGGQGGGHSTGRGIVMQIMYCCYDGDQDDARRIFSEADLGAIYDMTFSEFSVLYAAVNRVNGKDSTEQERLRDFSIATQALNNS